MISDQGPELVSKDAHQPETRHVLTPKGEGGLPLGGPGIGPTGVGNASSRCLHLKQKAFSTNLALCAIGLFHSALCLPFVEHCACALLCHWIPIIGLKHAIDTGALGVPCNISSACPSTRTELKRGILFGILGKV